MAKRQSKSTQASSRRPRPRTRTEKRSASTTWRRPRNMPLAVWEETNQNTDREMIDWARSLLMVDDDGNERRLTEEEVTAIAKPGRWAGAARAERKAGNAKENKKEEIRKKKHKTKTP